MATSKNPRPTHDHGDGRIGLLANGSSGQWEIAIDEATSGPDRWFAQIEGTLVSFYFEIPSVDIVNEMVQFFEPRPGTAKRSPVGSGERNNSLVISKGLNNPVILVRDDEYRDRFFLVVGLMENPLVRFVIAGIDAVDFAAALQQVKEDLDDEK
jgi:hypothetical protein